MPCRLLLFAFVLIIDRILLFTIVVVFLYGFIYLTQPSTEVLQHIQTQKTSRKMLNFIIFMLVYMMVATMTSEKEEVLQPENAEGNKLEITQLLKATEKILLQHKDRCLKSLAVYFFVLIFIGLPMWWITTSPYRASLENFKADEALIRNFLDIENSDKGLKDNSLDVWNEISISAAYNLHLIFIHEEPDNIKWDVVNRSISEVNKMVNYLSDTVFFSVMTEHFSDLFHFGLFPKNKSGKIYLNGADMIKLITAIDKHSSPLVSTDPLLKLVFVITSNGIEIDGNQSSGLTFASWGSIINVSPNKENNYINAIYESFHALLGVPNSIGDVPSTLKHPDNVAWNRFRRRAFSQNILKAIHFVTAINTLAEKMPQLVITSEVGELVRKSKNFVKEAIAEQSYMKASVARLLAERAADHGSLIGTGDLTSSLKIGIYIPIGMPLVLPIIEVILRYLWGKFRTRQQK